MYDFLYSEVWWRETLLLGLLVAGITSFAILASTWLSYNYRVSKDSSSLSGEHKDLSGEHKELSKEHVELREALSQKIQSASDGIKDILMAEKVEKEKKHTELLSRDKDILYAVKEVSDASAALYARYTELIALNAVLTAERNNLKQEVYQLRLDLNSVRHRYENELER